MRRWMTPLLLIAVGLSAAFLYRVKTEADAAAAELRRLQAAITREEEAARLLEAEIAARSRPERLRAMAEALGLLPPSLEDEIATDLASQSDDDGGAP